MNSDPLPQLRIGLEILCDFTESDGTGPEAVGCWRFGAGCWSSSLQCAVERHAIGHCRRRRTVRCHYCTVPAIVIALCPLAMPLAVVARCRRHRHASSSRCTPRCCALSLHCRAIVMPLDPPSSSPSAVITAPSPSSRCRALSPWCPWAPSSHRLRIPGPAAVAVRCCCALYPSCCTPLPSRCVRLHRHAVVRCHHRRAWCACLARLASVLWCGAWAVGLSMGWWRGHCWGPLHVACMAVIVVVRHHRCRRFVVSCNRHHALVRDAWVLQPGGGWLRGVALAPPDCGGGCTLWWVLVVHGARGWALSDRHRALVCSARAFGPGGGWLRGVALAPLNCGGGCMHYTLFLDSTLNPLRILNGWAHLDGGHIIRKGLMRGFERW